MNVFVFALIILTITTTTILQLIIIIGFSERVFRNDFCPAEYTA